MKKKNRIDKETELKNLKILRQNQETWKQRNSNLKSTKKKSLLKTGKTCLVNNKKIALKTGKTCLEKKKKNHR